MVTDVGGRIAQVCFDKLAEEGGIREVEAVGNLLDALVGVTQLPVDALAQVLMNPFQCRLAGGLLDRHGEVLRCDEELCGKVGDAVHAALAGGQQLHEAAAEQFAIDGLLHLWPHMAHTAVHHVEKLVDEHLPQ